MSSHYFSTSSLPKGKHSSPPPPVLGVIAMTLYSFPIPISSTNRFAALSISAFLPSCAFLSSPCRRGRKPREWRKVDWGRGPWEVAAEMG